MTNAHVSLQDFRHRLRRHLLGGIPGGPDGGGAPWLDGLVMEYLPSGNVLRITFPHIYFARWFAPHKTDFSAAVKAAWPDADAPRLEYVLPGRRLPRGPAPQVAPAARFFQHCPLEERTAPLFWQQAEALFLDDIQTLGGQPRSQRLLAALLAHRPEKAPVVLALEGGPDALGAWEPGPAASVRQLFSAELTPPDMEARMRYLQQCCRENALDLPREHLRLMARRAAHFHGLRSLLLRVKSAWEDDAARHPSLDDLERLARTGPVQACHAGHEQILAEAARCCDAAPADITGTGRHARLVMARQAAMYVCRRHLGLSYPELGRAFGGRDHSTVIHAVKKIGKMLESNKDVQHLVARLEKCAHQEQPDSSPTDEVFGA